MMTSKCLVVPRACNVDRDAVSGGSLRDTGNGLTENPALGNGVFGDRNTARRLDQPETASLRGGAAQAGLIGEHRRQPALGLRDAPALARRVVLDLVALDLGRRRNSGLRDGRDRARRPRRAGHMAKLSVSVDAGRARRRAGRTGSPSRCGRAGPDSPAPGGCRDRPRAISRPASAPRRRIAPELAAHPLVQALGEGLGQPVGERLEQDRRIVVMRGLEASLRASSPMPAVTAKPPT